MKYEIALGSFSEKQVLTIMNFLSRKFGIRQPAIDYYRAFNSKANYEIGASMCEKNQGVGMNNDLFSNLFLDLQVEFRKEHVEYRDALSIIDGALNHYPMITYLQ